MRPLPDSPEQEAPPPSAEEIFELLQKYGYALEHSTRPATVGLVVGSNPLSLLGWVGEKFLEWTDESPSVETILTMASLYWFTDCFTTSIYTYRYVSDPTIQISKQRAMLTISFPKGLGAKRHEASEEASYQKCPLGYSEFPKEITEIPAEWVKAQANMVWSKKHDSVSHYCSVREKIWSLLLMMVIFFRVAILLLSKGRNCCGWI